MAGRLRSRFSALGALLIIVLACVLSAARLALSRIDQQRPALEAWASHLVGAPVTLGAVHARWNAGLPVIVAAAISLKTDGAEILHFAHATAVLSLWRSLQTRHLAVDSLNLSGLKFTIVRRADGHFEIDGIENRDSKFMHWLLRQPSFSIAEADVMLRDERNLFAPLLAHNLNLIVVGAPHAARVRGRAGAIEKIGTDIDFELYLPTQTAGAAGDELRVAGAQLDLLALGRVLGRALGGPALPLASAQGNLRLWVTQRAEDTWRVALQASDLKVVPEHATHAKLAPFDFASVARVTASRVDANILPLAPNSASDHTWRLRVQRGTPLNLQASSEVLSLGLIQTLQPWLAQIPALQSLASTVPHLDGELRALKLGVNGAVEARHFYLAGTTHYLQLPPQGAWPGVTGLTTRFVANAAGGAAVLNDASFALNSPTHLIAPLQITAGNGLVRWNHGSPMTVDLRMSALLNGFATALTGSVIANPKGLPLVHLDGTFGTGELAAVPALVPTGMLHPHGEYWIRTAFIDGLFKSAHFALHGPLDAFPFDHDEGQFTADLTTDDVTLRYDPLWPAITDLNGTAVFDKRRLSGEITAAKFFDSPLKAAHFEIADVLGHDPVLTVNGTIRASLADTVQTLRESPLHGPTLATLSALEVSDHFELGLDLQLGLRQGAKQTVNGTVRFDGNTLHSRQHGFTLENLAGRLSFDGDAWQAPDLSAQFAGQPVQLSAHGGHHATNHSSEFAMRGTANAARIIDALSHYTPSLHQWMSANRTVDAVQGQTAWTAALSVPSGPPDQPAPSERLVIESNLEGLALALPWPLTKTAAQRAPLRIETELSSATHDTQVQLGDQLRLALRQTPSVNGAATLERAAVQFGLPTAPTLDHAGIYLSGELQELPLSEWAGLFKHGSSLASALPVAFDLSVQRLAALGQQFEAVKLTGSREAAAWRVHLESARALGDILLPHDLEHAPLSLNFERLWLARTPDQAQMASIDPRSLPAFTLTAASFKYNDTDLGQASLAFTRSADGLHLESLDFHNDAFQISATGNWDMPDNVQRSQFDIEVNGDKLGDILQHFGYAANAISGGRTHLTIDATWAGMPSDFTLDKLDGKLVMAVKKGRFLDIEPGGGRLFGLLSLQTLPRRLVFDFADIFQKGFAFDRIDGEFELDHGNAYTNHLLMTGPSATIEITGRTGLALQDYDQHAVVTPTLSKSIPLAGALFGPAGLGVGAAIYLGEKVFKEIPDQLDRFLQKKYTITGSWDNPKVTRL